MFYSAVAFLSYKQYFELAKLCFRLRGGVRKRNQTTVKYICINNLFSGFVKKKKKNPRNGRVRGSLGMCRERKDKTAVSCSHVHCSGSPGIFLVPPSVFFCVHSLLRSERNFVLWVFYGAAMTWHPHESHWACWLCLKPGADPAFSPWTEAEKWFAEETSTPACFRRLAGELEVTYTVSTFRYSAIKVVIHSVSLCFTWTHTNEAWMISTTY